MTFSSLTRSAIDSANPDKIFNLSFPLPLRLASLFILGYWLFAINVRHFEKTRISCKRLLAYNTESSPIFSQAAALTAIFYLVALIYWTIAAYIASVNWFLKCLIWVPFIAVVMMMFLPVRLFNHRGRASFASCMVRVFSGKMTKSTRFTDILIADVATSYSKVLGDLWICIIMTLSGADYLSSINRDAGWKVLTVAVLCFPSALRFKQCLMDYSFTKDKTHLYNAGKYFSAFPVILLSGYQSSLSTKETELIKSKDIKTIASVFAKSSSSKYSEKALKQLDDFALSRIVNDLLESNYWSTWGSMASIVAVIINTCYSFYWDIVFDWDLTLLNSWWTLLDKSHHYGLRERLHYGRMGLYYSAVVIDLVLRFSWAIRFAPPFYYVPKHEFGVFLFQSLEILRRWIWLFFRVETEWVRTDKQEASSVDMHAYEE
ncbi:hypothetical protein CANCADRAFT_147548 [Tortispora caseinolytica NRRL Y-17796]|uniref:EXS domain-containing protein n=1 Tax=Tortispora caseinolytica NRRL Y-17796 TaxID=767744 RepID=A0A1E4TKG0_9ASCO|nr:hypothetical protein CANCADRAFT_147548 [Tortispora caseinolytica NRRL Y-17796]